ncbi:hypothetical protein GCM10010430_68460 [Kitasatospora cystarginea]|uniref:Uncharacterized protein n=1 Tax=Kitasatospora cystarginea TaxID=58350 RepID=A0ABP5RRY1_9ACTN
MAAWATFVDVRTGMLLKPTDSGRAEWGHGLWAAGISGRGAVLEVPVSLTAAYPVVSAVPGAPAADGVSGCQVQSEGLNHINSPVFQMI